MAMTKKERAEFDAALLRAETLGALRWTYPVAEDVPAPRLVYGAGEYSEGWTFNAHSKVVKQGWSTSVSHGSGPAPIEGKYRSGSQNSMAMYSTELLALQAMRHAIENMAAEELRKVDRLIAKAKGEQP